MEDYVIYTENLSKTYGWLFWKKEKPSLDRLNLAIPKGVVFGFLGPNGAGKTTTIRLLMDLIKPSEGSAKVLGKSPDDVQIKHRIGFLPDAPAFSSYLSAYEFLSICAKLLKIPALEQRSRIEEVLATVKMSEHAKSKLGGFSRGMIQRIGIAQAIMNNPELLILDEPLVGLDPHGRQELKDIIKTQKEAGTNVFFCSHILSDVQSICDHIGILNHGKLLCHGAISDLLSEEGSKVNVAADKADLITDLLPHAVSSSKNKKGDWELVFSDDAEIKERLSKMKDEYPKDISISASRENLEDFFFRTIEKTRAEAE